MQMCTKDGLTGWPRIIGVVVLIALGLPSIAFAEREHTVTEYSVRRSGNKVVVTPHTYIPDTDRVSTMTWEEFDVKRREYEATRSLYKGNEDTNVPCVSEKLELRRLVKAGFAGIEADKAKFQKCVEAFGNPDQGRIDKSKTMNVQELLEIPEDLRLPEETARLNELQSVASVPAAIPPKQKKTKRTGK